MVLVGAWEAATVGGTDTPVPYNYPLYLDVLLLVLALWLLERSFRVVDVIVDEVKRPLAREVEGNRHRRHPPAGRTQSFGPAAASSEA